MIACPRCRHENPPAQKFCGECGARLSAACPSCGHVNPPVQRFCGECGTQLASGRAAPPASYTPKHLTERILTSKSALEGERKQVTVLFADLKGSMELLADRDPEEARNILDPVLERMMEAVHRYEGTINQVMGDGIMALFGAPLALEDHAVRACYAALRMQEQVSIHGDEMQRTHGTPIQLRVGLNSGEVVVRAIGNDLHMDYSAIGQTTHLAARMEQMAKPGTVLLSAESLKLAEGYVQVRSLGPVSVKGLAETIAVYELIGASAARTRLQAAAARGLTRFVGRSRELEVLAEALADAGKGKGQVVAIVGEPGVGKSRLYYEFIHSHRTQGWLTVEASSVSYGKATPYLPVIDLLKTYFKVGERDDARTIREKVTGKLFTLDRPLESLLSPLLALLDQPVDDPHWQKLDPPQRRRHTLDALRRLWLREAQAQPLILVFEDLHWIDTETQEFLDGLLDSIPTARLLLLFNYRPEYRHPWGSKSYYTQLRLDPLNTETVEDLLVSLLGNEPQLEPLKRLLSRRTEGNPFYLEESVRALVEAGVLAGDRGSHTLRRPFHDIEMPATVQAVLAARIDRLVPADKRLLQTAAVIGKDVPYAILQAVADMPEEGLRQGLSDLRAAEFLYEASLYPDLEYTFKHALTHDVAYAGLLQERRHELHARIVQAIETLYPARVDENAERLAHHAVQAQLWEPALRYLRQAARKASSRWAFREAARYLEQALEVAQLRLSRQPDSTTQEIDIRLDLRNAIIPSANFRRIADIIPTAIELAERTGDLRRLATAHAYQAQFSQELCRFDHALESGRRALALAQEIGDPVLLLSARHQLAGTHFTLGNFQQAVEVGRPAMAADPDLVVNAIKLTDFGAIPYFLPIAQAEAGCLSDAIADGETIMRRAEASGHPHASAMACVSAGFPHLRCGSIDQAIPILERGYWLCETYSVDVQMPWCASTLGLALALSGQWQEGIQYAKEAVKRGAALALTRFQPLRATVLANVYLLAGLWQEAQASAADALELARRYHEKGPEAWALYLLAASRDASTTDASNHAKEGYLTALRRSDELGMRPLSAHCHLGSGQLYAKLGDKRNAREHLERALALYRDMGMQHWPQQAEAALEELCGR